MKFVTVLGILALTAILNLKVVSAQDDESLEESNVPPASEEMGAIDSEAAVPVQEEKLEEKIEQKADKKSEKKAAKKAKKMAKKKAHKAKKKNHKS